MDTVTRGSHEEEKPAKRRKVQAQDGSVRSLLVNDKQDNRIQGGKQKSGYQIKKLVPPRPFPSVSPATSATGPRSARKDGKNYICLTRKTPLAAYMRRCKDLLMKDGYKTLHLSAMGAAIPHLSQLVLALPPILPYHSDEIHMDIRTGTVEVQDEVIPDDNDEDIHYRTRGKSSLLVIVKIGEGDTQPVGTAKESKNQKAKHTSDVAQEDALLDALEEPDQEMI